MNDGIGEHYIDEEDPGIVRESTSGNWTFRLTLRTDEETRIDEDMTPEDEIRSYIHGRWSFARLEVIAILDGIELARIEETGIPWGSIGGRHYSPFDTHGYELIESVREPARLRVDKLSALANVG